LTRVDITQHCVNAMLKLARARSQLPDR
jgi:hypothetical protein